MIGRTLSHYRILGKLGSGGMGQVYVAEDTKLGRKVALKVLPPQMASSERLMRFEREAKAVAALNHPNIVVIYSVEEVRPGKAEESLHFLTMELVEGRTLSDVIPRDGLPLERFFDLAIPLAQALAAAHDQGIVHRDLKPSNVMVTGEGRVKVLDFGLARLRPQARGAVGVGTDVPTEARIEGEELTEEGKILGTVAYMSPEQAEGKVVDHRSDIFSLGVLLYQMTTGDRPFKGDTSVSVISSIMKDTPRSVTDLKPNLPRDLGRIIKRCLAKDPRRRYQTATDVRNDLEDLKEEVESGELVPAMPKTLAARYGWSYRTVALVGVLAVAAALVAVLVLSPAPPQVTGYTQLTRSQVLFPPFPSPFPLVTDSSRIYFDEWTSGMLALRQVAITGGEAVPVASPFSPKSISLFWDTTPDRSQLLVGVGEPGDSESSAWLLPVVGGSPRRLGEVVGHQSTWSPDGSQILYVNGSALYLARSDGTQPRKLLSGPGRAYWPRFSPDGSRIRFTAFDPKSGLPNLWEASADGSDLHPLLSGWNDPPNQCCGSWTPDGKYYIFQATREYRSHLWAIREKGGLLRRGRSEPVQLTTGPMEFIRPLIGPDGKKIFAIGWQLRGELARYDAQSRQFVPYLSPLSAESLDFSRDGEWIAYVTYPEADLWRSRANGTERLQLTFAPMRASSPDWSPDGKTIAFEGQIPGQHWKIYLVPADGGTPRPLTPDDRLESSPTWSPQGSSLAFSLAGEEGIHIFDLEGGKASSLVAGSEALHWPHWSPDRRYLAAHSTDHRRVLLFDFDTERWQTLAEIEVWDQHWSADGEYLYVVSPPWLGPLRSIHRVRLRGGSREELVSLKEVRQAWGNSRMWLGSTPDGSPLLLRDLSIHHIYALDWEP